jgi:hypothetical protein
MTAPMSGGGQKAKKKKKTETFAKLLTQPCKYTQDS